jgi:[ribosomal protein S5]-alanine N-acetyltransferase
MGSHLRPLTMRHSDALADLYRRNRGFLATWEPDEPDEFFTPQAQQEAIASTLAQCRSGSTQAWVIVDGGEPVGRLNLNNIMMGALRSCSIGYWVSQRHGGRGIATRAVQEVLEIAFEELDLHRVDAFARVDNEASCRVLRRNGFQAVGVSRGHLHVAGRWQDEIYFQKLAPWDDGVQLAPSFDLEAVGAY